MADETREERNKMGACAATEEKRKAEKQKWQRREARKTKPVLKRGFRLVDSDQKEGNHPI